MIANHAKSIGTASCVRCLLAFVVGGLCCACETPETCVELTECESHEFCQAGRCVSNGDCDAYFDGFFVDANGVCAAGSKSGCADPFPYASQAECLAADCPPNPPLKGTNTSGHEQTCNYGEECCCGQCSPSMICSADSDGDYVCFNTDFCLSPKCGECTADDECLPGELCMSDGDSNVCIPGCREDADCEDAEACQPVQCIRAPCPAQCRPR